MPESLGRRLAAHRNKLGWTQQELADRLAVSRVTISHLEAGMTVPSERSIILLAGVFKVEPHDLVAGTAYPDAKRDRLPLVAAQYTEVEHRLGLLDAELVLLADMPVRYVDERVHRWQRALEELTAVTHDPAERVLVREAGERLRRWVAARPR